MVLDFDAPKIPCPVVPDVPADLSIPLPFGGELKAFRDFSKGIPDDCALVNNLMIQLAPTLAGLNCILKMLDALAAVKDWLTDITLPTDLVSGIPPVAEKLAALSDCFLMVTPAGICPLIKSILETVLKLLSCIIEAVRSVLDFQAGIDLDSAEGNPVLLASLQCAQDNSQVSLQHTLAALGPIEPIFSLLDPLMSIAGLSVETPPLADMAVMEDANAAVDQIEGVVDTLKDFVESLPC